MTPEQLSVLEQVLRRQREAILQEGDIEIHAENETGDTARRPDEDLAPYTEMDQVIASARNRQRTEELHRIDDALHRLKASAIDFGLCDYCAEPVAWPRLNAMPWVKSCIECQSKVEREKAPGRRRHATDYKA